MSPVEEMLRAAAPIESVALAIARDAYPRLQPETYLRRLDAMAQPLAERFATPGGVNPDDRLRTFVDYVYDELGFTGNADDYYDPRNSYLNDVIDRRTGIPITLAVVLIALGRRVGLTLRGVGFPGHFIVRIERSAVPGVATFVDPFNRGEILEREDLLDIVRRVLGDRADLAPEQLEPVGNRSMAVRMLFNLQNLHQRRGDHAGALVACDRLCELADAPFHRRDRGVHALALGAVAAAVDDLETYLEQAPDAPDRDRIEVMLARASMRAPAASN
ncbi:MAG: transglutaminase-like domain-containing protein [Myxococcota bacterium]